MLFSAIRTELPGVARNLKKYVILILQILVILCNSYIFHKKPKNEIYLIFFRMRKQSKKCTKRSLLIAWKYKSIFTDLHNNFIKFKVENKNKCRIKKLIRQKNIEISFFLEGTFKSKNKLRFSKFLKKRKLIKYMRKQNSKLRKPKNKLRFLKFFKKVETDKKNEETDLKIRGNRSILKFLKKRKQI